MNRMLRQTDTPLRCERVADRDAFIIDGPQLADLKAARRCLAHRCDEHEDIALHNANGPDQSECAMCLVEAFILAYEKQFEKTVFWPTITSARDRLNLLAPGAGDALVDEARAILNAAALDEHAGEDQIEFARRVAIECGADAQDVEDVLRRLT